MKLWQKQESVADQKALLVEEFTVGKDRIWDMRLARYDVLGSIAHATMLGETGIITTAQSQEIVSGLHLILDKIEDGTFVLEEHVEDIHSQVEKDLILMIGEPGKALHTGRSRNDQVLTDIKLYLKDAIRELAAACNELFIKWQELSERHSGDLLPGYTHLQLAMPSSFGLWFGAYAESLTDDLEMLLAAYKITDKNPLGSGAGYGSAFPLNRKRTTELLDFSELNYNSVYAQMTRGKTERATLMAMSSIASTLSRFAYDVCLFMNQHFGLVSFADNITTGSSIMPHKKNPDVFELIRAKCNRIQAAPNELTLLCSNLPSGYHRDMQLTKDILFPAIDSMNECLRMMIFAMDEIKVKSNALASDGMKELFSVEAINQLVVTGMPFRDAYRKVGLSIQDGTFNPPTSLNHTHEGSIGNLCNKEIAAQMKSLLIQFQL